MAAVVCFLPGAAMAEKSPIEDQEIEAANEASPRSDAACITELNDGRLMMVYQKSEGGTAQDGGYKKIWSKVSADGGRTWTEPRMLVDKAPGDIYAAGPSILRLESGAILLSCVGLTEDHLLTTQYLYRSENDGKTFAPMEPIWKHTRRDASQGGATSMLQLESGRIIFPVSCYLGPPLESKKERRDSPRTAWCFYSDDDGKTWHESEKKVPLPKRGALEPSITQLADGSLLMAVRTQLGGPYLARSTDEGKTWSEPVFSGLEGGESCTALRRVPGSDDVVLIWNHSRYDTTHRHFGLRTPLNSAVSGDGGQTWKNIRKLRDDEGAEFTNPNLFFTRDGRAIVTYATSVHSLKRERMPLRALSVDTDWMTGR